MQLSLHHACALTAPGALSLCIQGVLPVPALTALP